jgi:hypothetical protein
MPNFISVSDTAIARYAVAPLESAVNILKRLKEISDRAEEISDRVFVACIMAEGELEGLEPYDLGDEPNDRRNALADDLLEIKIATHDLDELIARIDELMS